MAIGERSALAAERLAIEHQVQRREFRVHLRRDRESQSHLPRYIRATRHALEDKLVFLLLEQLVPAVISFKQPPHAVARLMGDPFKARTDGLKHLFGSNPFHVTGTKVTRR